jgi:hypothetical protein
MLDVLKEFGLFLKWVTLSFMVIFLVVLLVASIVEISWVIEECC